MTVVAPGMEPIRQNTDAIQSLFDIHGSINEPLFDLRCRQLGVISDLWIECREELKDK